MMMGNKGSDADCDKIAAVVTLVLQYNGIIVIDKIYVRKIINNNMGDDIGIN